MENIVSPLRVILYVLFNIFFIFVTLFVILYQTVTSWNQIGGPKNLVKVGGWLLGECLAGGCPAGDGFLSQRSNTG